MGRPYRGKSLAEAAFLVLVSSAAVTPARQMNFGVAEQLRRAGYPTAVIESAVSLRERFGAWAAAPQPRRSPMTSRRPRGNRGGRWSTCLTTFLIRRRARPGTPR